MVKWKVEFVGGIGVKKKKNFKAPWVICMCWKNIVYIMNWFAKIIGVSFETVENFESVYQKVLCEHIEDPCKGK